MSSNFVHQKLPIPSMDMSQLEPSLNNVEAPISEIQMGAAIGSTFSGSGSQQFLVSNSQTEMMPNYIGSEGLSTAYMQMGHIANTNGNLGDHKLFTPHNQFGEIGGLPSNPRSYQLTSMKRKVPWGSMFLDSLTHQLLMPNKKLAQEEHRPWLQQAPAENRRVVQLDSMASVPGSQSTMAPNKMVKVDSFSGRSGPQRSSSRKNQISQIQSSPKGQSAAFESVRSKMRESLATALALVNQQQDKSPESKDKSQGTQPETFGPVKHECKEEPKEDSQPSESYSATKSNNVENAGLNIISDAKTSDPSLTSICEGKEFQSSNIMPYDVPFGDTLFVKDDLLQGNGLSWALESDILMTDGNENFPVKQELEQERIFTEEKVVQSVQKVVVQSPEELAYEIEAELFKLFGGVNKKYKEKGRSLLFNLKDRNNPELRERVMSGEIIPGRLCSMTAEELASKELSEWRTAKAEELAQMVVLPDSDLDVRRLVKKTHKGEVEVEQFDDIPTEVPISRDEGQPRSKEAEVSTPLKSVRSRNEGESNVDESYTSSSSDGSDLLQGLMVDDELKDLPPIVSLDEFMESLDNEPPFEIAPEKGTAASEKEDSENGSYLKASGLSPKDSIHSSPPKGDEMDRTDSKPEDIIKSEDGVFDTKSEDKPAVIKSEDNSAVRETSDCAVKSGDSITDLNSKGSLESTAVQKPEGERLWEGAVQLSVSTKAAVIGIFKSGEKVPVKDWSRSLEIKGRVRLDAFEKFLQELPQSRSRAVMVVQFVPKDGSSETEIASLREVGESYVSDERVGFAEPCSGVELYLCPPHNKICSMLSNIIQKEHVEALNTIENGLIGVVVWRKPTSPKQKHASKKQHYSSSSSSSRKHYITNSNANHISKPSQPRNVFPPTNRNVKHNDEDDEAPPGFGPPGRASRDVDDLPEFNFNVASNQSLHTQRSSRGYSETRTSRPVDKMRELILKYGHNQSRSSWNNDDDDDIPEWQPTVPPTQYQLPQHQPVSSYQQPLQQQQQQPLPQGHAPSSNPYWQQGNQWLPPPPPLAHSGAVGTNAASQPEFVGQFYGEHDRGNIGQPGIASWPQNDPRNRRF